MEFEMKQVGTGAQGPSHDRDLFGSEKRLKIAKKGFFQNT